MREILFRGKRLDNGEWVYGFYAHELQGQHYILADEGAWYDGPMLTCVEVDAKTVGQYIGINDKYDVKIFEGDIVRNKRTGVWHAQGDVRYGKYLYSADDEYECPRYGFYVHSPWKAYTDNTGYCFTYLDINNWEIIGTIHDNPELLDVE